MAVALDATGTKLVGASSAVSTIAYTGLTVGAGLTNGALVAWLNFGITSTPTGLTAVWDSVGANQAMSLIGSQTVTGGGSTETIAFFGLRAPTAGNKTLTFSWTGTGNFPTACAISLSGAEQSSVAAAFKNFVSNTSTALSANAALSTTVTSAVGDMVIGGLATGGAFAVTPMNGTIVFSDNTSSGADSVGNRQPGAATVTVTATNGATICSVVVAGFDVAAAAGAAFIARRNNPNLQAINRASYW